MALQNIKIEKEKSKDGLDKMSEQQRPFSKTNFLMMGVCLALIVIGFLLMAFSIIHMPKGKAKI